MTGMLRLVLLAVAVAVSTLGSTTSLLAGEELTPSTLWDVRSDFGGADYPFRVAVGLDGHPVVAVTSTGFGRAIKYDGKTGAVLWNVTYSDPGGAFLEFLGIAVGPDGNPVVVGSVIDDSCLPGYACRPLAVKYDGSNGAVLWVTGMSGSLDFMGVAIGSDGHPVVSRNDCDPNTCGVKTVKLDGATGVRLWTSTFSSQRYENVEDVTIGPHDDPVSVGSSLLEYEGDTGVILKDLGRFVDFGVASAAVAADWDMFVTGISGGFFDEDGFLADSRVGVARLKHESGKILWSVAVDLPSSTVDVGRKIALGADGHPLVLGNSCVPHRPDCDWVTMKLAAGTGALMWSVTLSPPGNHDQAMGLAAGPDGNPVIAGADCPTSFVACAIRGVKYLLRYQTDLGFNVAVAMNGGTRVADGASLTFARVTTAGASTLVTGASGPPPPPGVALGKPATYYDVATTADFTGSVQVCFNYGQRPVSSPEKDLKLFSFDGGHWTDVTTSLNRGANVICGEVNRLSTFLLATKVSP